MTDRQWLSYSLDQLPVSLQRVLKYKSLLFVGYSPADRDLNLIASYLWKEGINTESWFIHQSLLGELEQRVWKARGSKLVLSYHDSVDAFIGKLADEFRREV